MTATNNNYERSAVGDRVTITRRGNSGIYQAEFHYDDQHRRKSLKTKSNNTATQRASLLDAQLLSGEFQSIARSIGIEEAIEKDVEFKPMEDRASKTLVKYRGQLQRFREFCDKLRITRLSQIRPMVFDEFRQSRKEELHRNTWYQEAVTIKQWLKWCCNRELVSEDPLRNCRLEKPKRGKPKPAPTLGEVWSILDACREPLRFHVATPACTGMRSGEMRQLRDADVDLARGWYRSSRERGSERKRGSRGTFRFTRNLFRSCRRAHHWRVEASEYEEESLSL